MSKARRKAYLAYTQQMAEYFAEVGRQSTVWTLQPAQLSCITLASAQVSTLAECVLPFGTAGSYHSNKQWCRQEARECYE
jgi:hypothetical protein